MTQAAQLASYGSSGVGLGFKNRIINGAMQIDQRNAGASVTPSFTAYTVDRWQMPISQASKISFQQTSTAVGGIPTSIKFTTVLPVSVGSGDYFIFVQPIEGYNVADLGWGAVGASAVTLSFKVNSSVTGTFGGALFNSDASRSYPFSYTISSPNTDTSISITIPGDTTGTWLKTNGIGISVSFSLGTGTTLSGTAGSWASASYRSATGATGIVGTNGATFYITGVQLEKGSVATSFDYRPYGTELALCQRYLPAFNSSSTDCTIGIGYAYTSTDAGLVINLPVSTRVPPTGISNTAASGFKFYAVAGFTASSLSFGNASNTVANISLSSSGMTAGQAGRLSMASSSAQLLFTGCEL